MSQYKIHKAFQQNIETKSEIYVFKQNVLMKKNFISYFQGVSSNENGLYTCVCKHVRDNSFYSETVELIVKKDWEEVYETDPFVSKFNLF